MSTTPALPAPSAPPPRPPATHQEIDSRGFGEPMRKALHLVLDGTPYRDAAREVGLASHQDLHRAAKRLGLLEVHTRELVSQCKRVAHLSGSELERRLVENPDSIGAKDLSVISGIALDKIAKFEGWGHSRALEFGAAVVDRLSQLEGKLNITVERAPSPGGAAPPTIDVTPGKTGA